ncbi:hypothetical protein, partial [Klebsiella pneumoniae]|uniref:hypothetical protein n=1 Tax=Klebsiella pneumoniae TaxID=573 RepID=UPI003EE23C49
LSKLLKGLLAPFVFERRNFIGSAEHDSQFAFLFKPDVTRAERDSRRFLARIPSTLPNALCQLGLS